MPKQPPSEYDDVDKGVDSDFDGDGWAVRDYRCTQGWIEVPRDLHRGGPTVEDHHLSWLNHGSAEAPQHYLFMR
jgi:hypothetical protein